MQDSSDDRAPRERIRVVSRNRLYYSSLLCAASVLIFLGCVWLAFRDVAASISIWAVGSTLFSAGLALVTHGRRVPRRLLPVTGAALALAVYATLFYSFLVIRSAGLTLFLVMVVLATGVMQSSARWLTFTLAVMVGSWVVTGLLMLGASFVPVATGSIFAAFVALFLHLFVVRHLAHMKELRRRDRMHGEELGAALAAAHHELIERQRAEAERERLREQLLHSQKLEAIGTLAGGVAHDMNNMLAAILGLAELARDEPGTAREAIEQIIGAARRGSDLVRNLLGFSRRGQYRKEHVALSSVVAGITGLLARTLPKEVEILTSSKATHAVEGDVTQLGQALLNLSINASDAMQGRGVLRIDVDEVLLEGERARSLGVSDGRYVTLSVSDTGSGMDAATRSRMFEPFFTTKPPGRGTGLGLAMVYGTITNHGGAIAVDTEVGRGTSITLHLPAVMAAVQSAGAAEPAAALDPSAPAALDPSAPAALDPSAPAALDPSAPAALDPSAPAALDPSARAALDPSAPAALDPSAPAALDPSAPAALNPPAPAASGRSGAQTGVILVVDDEPLIRGVTRRSLERAGYQVLTASDGAEGLAIFQERATDIGVVVLDMAMPVMGGAECFRRLRAVDPRARVLLASGYALEEEARACLAAGALGFLEKPFRTARLLEAVALARTDRRVDEHLSLPTAS